MSCADRSPSFLVLNREAAWRRGLALHLLVSDAGIELEQATEHEIALEPQALPAELSAVDFAVACCQVYLLDTVLRSLYAYDPNADQAERMPLAETLFTGPAAVACAQGTLFVADPGGTHRVVALAEVNGQIRWTVEAGHDAGGGPLGLPVPFLPVDLAVDGAGRLHALAPLDVAGDRVPAGGSLAVLVFDRAGRIERLLRPAGLTLSAETLLTDLGARLFLAVAADGTVFVLDGPGRRVLAVSREGDLVLAFPVGLAAPAGLGIDSAGSLYVGDGRREIPAGEEDDRFLHRFDAAGVHLGVVSGYRGPVGALAVGPADRIYVFDPVRRRLFVLALRTGLRKPASGPPRGVYYSPPLDSAEDGVRWHKVRLDMEVPGNAQVRVSCLAAEDSRPYEAILDNGALSKEQTAAALDALAWSVPQVNARDALLDATGRYLALRIELAAVDREAPRVRSVEAQFPRRSYLRYLPAVYQEDERSRDFLERFLSLFETFFAGIEQEIDRLPRTFDADVATGELLSWLASWLALAAEEGWPEERLRTLVRRAPELYRRRGTRPGIEALIEIFTGEIPWIVEAFQLDCTVDPDVRRLLARLYGTDPYGFCVLLKPFQAKDDEELRAVQRLVDAEKPAHTRAGVRALQPWLQLDMHTYLELNTYLTRPSPRLDTGTALSRDAVLDDPEASGQVEIRTRIGIDTSLT